MENEKFLFLESGRNGMVVTNTVKLATGDNTSVVVIRGHVDGYKYKNPPCMEGSF